MAAKRLRYRFLFMLRHKYTQFGHSNAAPLSSYKIPSPTIDRISLRSAVNRLTLTPSRLLPFRCVPITSWITVIYLLFFLEAENFVQLDFDFLLLLKLCIFGCFLRPFFIFFYLSRYFPNWSISFYSTKMKLIVYIFHNSTVFVQNENLHCIGLFLLSAQCGVGSIPKWSHFGATSTSIVRSTYYPWTCSRWQRVNNRFS